MSFMDKASKNIKSKGLSRNGTMDIFDIYEQSGKNMIDCPICKFPMVPDRDYGAVGVMACTNEWCLNNPNNVLEEQGISDYRELDALIYNAPNNYYSNKWNPRSLDDRINLRQADY